MRRGAVALAVRTRLAGEVVLPPSPVAAAAFSFHRLPVSLRGDRGGGAWDLRYGLSYRDIEELLAERGVEVDHVTVYRWVRRFTPLLADGPGSPGDPPGAA